MDKMKNPLINTDPSDTLHRAHCMLLVLEGVYASCDHQWLQEHSICTGIHSVLQCANEAIAYELDRMETLTS